MNTGRVTRDSSCHCVIVGTTPTRQTRWRRRRRRRRRAATATTYARRSRPERTSQRHPRRHMCFTGGCLPETCDWSATVGAVKRGRIGGLSRRRRPADNSGRADRREHRRQSSSRLRSPSWPAVTIPSWRSCGVATEALTSSTTPPTRAPSVSRSAIGQRTSSSRASGLVFSSEPRSKLGASCLRRPARRGRCRAAQWGERLAGRRGRVG